MLDPSSARIGAPALIAIGALLLAFAAGPASAEVERPGRHPEQLQRLSLPASTPESFDVVVRLGDADRTLRLRRHSMRDAEFRARAWLADGRTVEIAPADVATYRGTLAGRPEVEVVAHLTPEGLEGWVVPAQGPAWTIRPGSGEDRRKGDARHRIERVSGAAAWFVDGCPEGRPAPLDLSREVPPPASAQFTLGTTGQQRAQIAFDVDYQYYVLKGSSVSAGVAAVEAIMNQVDFFYARDVLITYKISDVIVRTSQFYFPTGGGDLLDQFRAEWNTNQTHIVRDLAHLMTDKDNIEFGGLAWVGVVCTASAYGWSLDSAGIVGHEVGHNWGAGHCHDVTPCNNMCGACLYVAPNTKQIISAHRDSRTCLDAVGAYATPVPPYAHPEDALLTRDELAASATRTFDVLANDHDGNLDPLSLDGFETPSQKGGPVTLSPGSGGDGRDELVYTASGEVFSGDDGFEYTVGDGTGLQAVGQVTLQVLAPSLAGYWKLDDGVGTTAADASGENRPGEVAGAATWAGGVHGGALSFDGVDDSVVVPPLNRPLHAATIATWLNRVGGQVPWAGIVFSRDGNTSAGLNFGNADELRYHWNGTASTYTWDSGLVVPDGQWVFVALVVEPHQATMHLHDGSAWQSAVHAVSHDPEEFDGEIQLGQDPAGGRWFAGLLDDVRLYDYALDATEIAALHELGGKAYAPQPRDGGKLLPSIGELAWSAGLGAQSHDLYFGTDYVAVRDATPASAEYRGNFTTTRFVPTGPLMDGVTYFWRVDEVQGGQAAVGDAWIFSLGAAAGHWKLDETTGTVAADSGAAFDGQYVGAPQLDQVSAQPILGSAVGFDGINDTVQIPALDLVSDRVTLSAWVRREGDQSPFSGILFSRAGSTTAGLNVGDGNELRYHWNDGNWDWDSGLVLPDAEWVFVALVVEPSRATIYLGQAGAVTASTHFANHGVEEFDGPLFFAQDPTGGRWFAGAMDDVRLYRHALSAADVEALYTSMGVAAGSVPDAAPGPPLRIERVSDDDLALTWASSCVESDDDYAVYEGTLGDWTTHLAATCSTGGATSWTLTPQSGSRYYLVVPRSVNREGAYGADAGGNPRRQSSAPCLPQFVSACN
ncbi:MAG: hypothetical protein GY716_18065 [bacterium]|nr:hypothetical protein [bacterium]